jgi:hypothetical protein
MGNSFRSFSVEVETLAAEWTKHPVSTEKWEDLGFFGNSESKPFRVSNGAFVGLAKPGERKSDGIARAAHEKIVSDLAYHLHLPVPPVLLWDRASSENTRERYVSISAWAFAPTFTWDEGSKNLSEEHRKEASRIVSAMLPFETWVSAQDRKSDHLIVNTVGTNLQLAFIDYAYSLSFSWAVAKAAIGASPSYVPVTKDQSTIGEVSELISTFEPERIRTIVNGVPVEYLSDSQRDTIIANLISRRDDIKALMGV